MRKMASINDRPPNEELKPRTAMSPTEAMKNLGIKDRRTLNKLFKQGLPRIKIGKTYMIPIKEFNTWFDKHIIRG